MEDIQIKKSYLQADHRLQSQNSPLDVIEEERVKKAMGEKSYEYEQKLKELSDKLEKYVE